MRNFPFIHEGKEYWYSRSVVTSAYVYAKWNGKWHVLVAKRGTAASFPHKWNVPSGFLDHNEQTSHATQRETWEETGVLIPAHQFKLAMVNSIPSGKLQHIIFSYVCNLGKVDELPKLSFEHNEPNENEKLEWIDIDLLDYHEWILDHKQNIRKFFWMYVRPSLWQRIKNALSNQIDKTWVV